MLLLKKQNSGSRLKPSPTNSVLGVASDNNFKKTKFHFRGDLLLQIYPIRLAGMLYDIFKLLKKWNVPQNWIMLFSWEKTLPYFKGHLFFSFAIFHFLYMWLKEPILTLRLMNTITQASNWVSLDLGKDSHVPSTQRHVQVSGPQNWA